jgi:hypothetical protein
VTQSELEEKEAVSRSEHTKADEAFDTVGAAISTAVGGALLGTAVAGVVGAATGAAVGAVVGGIFLRPTSNHHGTDRNSHKRGEGRVS